MSIRPGLLTALLKAGHLHGAIRWKIDVDLEACEQEVSQFGYVYRLVDTTGVDSIEDFFRVANQQLQLVKESDLSIDNFEASLQTLPENTVVVWVGWQDFAQQSANDAALVAELFDGVAQSWSGSVLIFGKSGTIPNVAELTAVG